MIIIIPNKIVTKWGTHLILGQLQTDMIARCRIGQDFYGMPRNCWIFFYIFLHRLCPHHIHLISTLYPHLYRWFNNSWNPIWSPHLPPAAELRGVTRWMTEPSTISNRPSSRCRRCSWPNFSRNDVWGLSGVSEKRPFGAGQFPSIIYSIHIYRYIIYIYYTCPTSPPFTDLFFNCHV